MNRVYRLLRKPYAKEPLNGEGAYRFGGRWSSVGTRIAYTAEHMSLAMIEYFVHIDADLPPRDLVVVTADVPENVSRKTIAVKELPANWRQTPAPPELAEFGDRFALDGRTAALIVPSAISPAESNWLINPRHPEFVKIRLRAVDPFDFDPRLLPARTKTTIE